MNATQTIPQAPHLRELRDRIAASAYVVDPVLVANALLRRQGLELLGFSARSPSG